MHTAVEHSCRWKNIRKELDLSGLLPRWTNEILCSFNVTTWTTLATTASISITSEVHRELIGLHSGKINELSYQFDFTYSVIHASICLISNRLIMSDATNGACFLSELPTSLSLLHYLFLHASLQQHHDTGLDWQGDLPSAPLQVFIQRSAKSRFLCPRVWTQREKLTMKGDEQLYQCELNSYYYKSEEEQGRGTGLKVKFITVKFPVKFIVSVHWCRLDKQSLLLSSCLHACVWANVRANWEAEGEGGLAKPRCVNVRRGVCVYGVHESLPHAGGPGWSALKHVFSTERKKNCFLKKTQLHTGKKKGKNFVEKLKEETLSSQNGKFNYFLRAKW